MPLETLDEKLTLLFDTAERAQREGLCVLTPGAYGQVIDEKRSCCVLGAASLVFGADFRDLCADPEWGFIEDTVDNALRGFALSPSVTQGVIDGFDNLSLQTDQNDLNEYRQAYAAARAFAVRMKVKGTEHEQGGQTCSE